MDVCAWSHTPQSHFLLYLVLEEQRVKKNTCPKSVQTLIHNPQFYFKYSHIRYLESFSFPQDLKVSHKNTHINKTENKWEKTRKNVRTHKIKSPES
jgi:hypothetical protein